MISYIGLRYLQKSQLYVAIFWNMQCDWHMRATKQCSQLATRGGLHVSVDMKYICAGKFYDWNIDLVCVYFYFLFFKNHSSCLCDYMNLTLFNIFNHNHVCMYIYFNFNLYFIEGGCINVLGGEGFCQNKSILPLIY